MFDVPSSRAREAEIRQETSRLALYQYAMCPYCVLVKNAIRRLGLEIEMRDTLFDAGARAELREATGLSQVPCLRITGDDGSHNWLFESRDIVRYLEDRFGA